MRHTPTYRPQGAPEDRRYLLHSLIEAEGAFVSGTDWSNHLGISRTAIWFKIQALKEAGFDIEAMPQRGYRMVGSSNVLHAILLEDAADSRKLKLPILYYPELDSTNDEAERQLNKGRRAPFAVLAGRQTEGRGRRQRHWYSASKKNLYLTVAFEPRLPASQLQHFTLWSGIHLCQSLQELVPQAPLQLKWPNDLYCEGKKLAGMLAEARIDADGLNTLLFGFGLNVNSQPSEYPDELSETATSLCAVGQKMLPLNEVATICLQAIQQAYERCLQGTDADSLTQEWNALDCLAGKTVMADHNGTTIEGIARGIDASGALRIEEPNRNTQLVHAGDVTLRKA
ncbi:MAG: biotin--[acetyl-CoA-carboxylase] ligase [Coraliomargaritaceae bacterium]